MGYKEETFIRFEHTGFDTVAKALSYLSKDKSGRVVRAETVKLQQFAEDLAQPVILKNKLTKADTLNEVMDLSDDIDDLEIEVPKSKLIELSKERKENRARNIFSNVGATGSGLNNIISVLERRDYDLTRLKYHSFKVRGRTRIGVWESGRIGFIANINAEPKEIEEEAPSFETGEDVKE